MSEMAFTRFSGQFQVEKSMVGRLDNSGAGFKMKTRKPNLSTPEGSTMKRPLRAIPASSIRTP